MARNSSVTVSSNIKSKKHSVLPSARRCRGQGRVRDCQRPLPAQFKLSAIKNTHFSDSPTSPARKITRLPALILGKIYDDLTHPRQQLAFTLTCRRFTAVAAASSKGLIKGSARQNGVTRKYGKEHVLHDLKEWGWVPEGLKICKVCLKYLPENQIWKLGDGREIKALKKVDWVWAVGRWVNGGKVCPTCAIERSHAWKEEIEGEEWVQLWGEGFVEDVMVKRGFVDE